MNNQIRLAKSILESAGYRVTKISESSNFSDEIGKGTTLSDLIHERADSNPRFKEIAGVVSDKVSDMLGASPDNIYVISEDSDEFKQISSTPAKYQKSEKIGAAGEFVLYVDEEGRKYVYHNYEKKVRQIFYT